MTGSGAMTIINNARRDGFTEAGLWLVIGTLAVTVIVIGLLEWLRRRPRGPKE